jgi:hypothetical protein
LLVSRSVSSIEAYHHPLEPEASYITSQSKCCCIESIFLCGVKKGLTYLLVQFSGGAISAGCNRT